MPNRKSSPSKLRHTAETDNNLTPKNAAYTFACCFNISKYNTSVHTY